MRFSVHICYLDVFPLLALIILFFVFVTLLLKFRYKGMKTGDDRTQTRLQHMLGAPVLPYLLGNPFPGTFLPRTFTYTYKHAYSVLYGRYIKYAYKCICCGYIMSSINKGSLIGCPQHWELSPAALLLPFELFPVILGEAEQGSSPGRE